MTSDKMAWMVRAHDPHSRQVTATSNSQDHLTALRDVIRAQLMHVAVGYERSPSRAIRILIDLSVYLSTQDLKTALHGRMSKAVMPYNSKASLSHIDMYDTVAWDKTLMIDMHRKSVCTALTIGSAGHVFPVSGEPVTLRLLFSTQTELSARTKAEQICERFSYWYDTGTSLREAMSAIHAVITGHTASDADCDRLCYRSAAVRKGWQQHITDPASFIACGVKDLISPLSSRETSQFFLYTLEDAWRETAKKFDDLSHYENTPADTESDLGTSSDAASEFVCADRMRDLWYGRKKQRHQG